MPVAYAAGFREIYGADTDRPEHELWRAVLRLAGEDLFAADETIRQNAMNFFESPNLPLIMDLAGISRAHAPWLRRRALELAEAAQATPTVPGKRITHQGRTHTITEWAKLTGLSIHALSYRLRAGWSVEKALTVPMQKASGHSRKVKRSIPTPTGPTISALATSANAEVNAEVKQSGKPVVDQREIQWKIARTEAGGQRYS